MFPLDSVYGPRAYRAFQNQGAPASGLKHTRQRAVDIFGDEPLVATSYTELVDMVAFFSVMNKRQSLYFRGQGRHLPPIPALFRSSWKSIGGTEHNVPKNPAVLQRIYDHLNTRTSNIVLSVCLKFPMPRQATLKMFREAVWAVAQHYELWPTPLIDITPNLRVGASFALWDGRHEGNLYIVAMPPSTNSITFEADQHVVLARLQAICPPIAKRPHYQDGFLVGRFPFVSPSPNQIDNRPDEVSNLSRRLVARIVLKEGSSGSFWNEDFPRMSTSALLPRIELDKLLEEFTRCANDIDEMMQDICGSEDAAVLLPRQADT
jgi:FRG domain